MYLIGIVRDGLTDVLPCIVSTVWVWRVCLQDASCREKSGVELEMVDKKPLLEFLAENYKKWGCTMEFVTDRSQEGSQFCRGFGGIGGLLRYAVDLTELQEPDEEFGDMWDEDAW